MLALGAGLIAASAVMVLGGMSGLSLGVMLSGVGLVGAVVLAFLPIDWRELGQVALEGLWALLLPVVILGGIYSGLFNATEAAAVAVVYAVFVERFIYSSMNWREMMDPLMDSVVMMGALLIIIGMALGFNRYLVDAQIDRALRGWLNSTSARSASCSSSTSSCWSSARSGHPERHPIIAPCSPMAINGIDRSPRRHLHREP